MRDVTRTATTSDDDLDPALRADGVTAGGASPVAATDQPEETPELPPSREEPRRDEEVQHLRDRLSRAEGMIEAGRRQELEESARRGAAPPSDPVERQYFDIFSKWLSPQLEQAGQRIGQVVTGLADRDDQRDLEMKLLRRGLSDDQIEDTAREVEKVRQEKLGRGTYFSRADALEVYEGRLARKGRRIGGRGNGNGGDVAQTTRSAREQNAETQALRERAKDGAMVPTGAPAGRRVPSSEKRDEDLTLEELEDKYADHWV